MRGIVHILSLLVIVCLTACSPRSVRQAQMTVKQADSAWAKGQPYADSAQLAQAYTTLDNYQYLYPDEYAHACYHYGRLLRAQDNPVEAMQCFINATHSCTHDYHILGRVYSNMGSICHLADAFALSYDMYERSAEMFLRNGDTMLYYYDLNNMAFEKIMLGEPECCFDILNNIDASYTSDILRAHCNLTRAQAHMKMQVYDSTICYAAQAHYGLNDESAISLLMAQAYSYLGLRDSAVYYAERVLVENPTLEEADNALYILTNDDESKCVDEVRKVSADRSDTQKVLEVQQGKLSQAVQLLEQDLQRKPDLRWLYAVLATLLLIAFILFLYIRNKRKHHQLLSQQIDDLELKSQATLSQKRAHIEETCLLFANSPSLKTDLHWSDYTAMCKCADAHFYMIAEKLRQKQILNEQEIRLCILTLINISRNQIADILPYAPNGVGKLKYRVAQKMGIEGKNLRKYLVCLAIDEPYK